MKLQRGFGLAGELDTPTIVQAAVTAELAGYDTYWLSQPAKGSTLVKLAEVAAATSQIRLGVGAIPFTKQSAADLVEEIESLSLPLDRLRLGVGSGIGHGSLDRLREGVDVLRSLIDVEIAIAPLGPEMCRLAGQLADTVLLNWLTPAFAQVSKEWITEGARQADRMPPIVATYVRCALGRVTQAKLEAESQRYGAFPHYARHFSRQDVSPMATTILAQDGQDLQQRIAEYEAVLDHVVIRAITPTDSPVEIAEMIVAGQPKANAFKH